MNARSLLAVVAVTLGLAHQYASGAGVFRPNDGVLVQAQAAWERLFPQPDPAISEPEVGQSDLPVVAPLPAPAGSVSPRIGGDFSPSGRAWGPRMGPEFQGRFECSHYGRP